MTDEPKVPENKLNPDMVEQLLNVVNLAKQWPNLKGIHDTAMKALEAHSKAMAVQLEKERIEEEAAVAREKDAVIARAKAKQEAEELAAKNTARVQEKKLEPSTGYKPVERPETKGE